MASHSEELPESSGSVSGAKGRKNWTYDETQVLMNLAIAKRELLRGQFKGTDAVSKRDKAWEEIVSAVNAVSVIHRDHQACEMRLRCFPHTVKKAVSAEEHENRKTGGGPPAGPTYQPELVQLALNWLDITTLEGCTGGGESTLEPEEEEEVERLRLLHKSTALERQDKLQESIDESAVNLVDSVPSLQKYLKTSKRQPIIVETDEDSTPANTPRKCVISRPRPTTRATNREGVGQELTVVVDSIDNLTKVVQDSSNNIRLAIRTAARDFMGLQRGATFVDAYVGSDVPFKYRKADVFTQVNPEALAEECPQTEKNERALRNLLKVLGDELPKVNEVSWQHIIGDAMKYNLKNLSEEERNFNVFMDLVGDDGQTEVMKFFKDNAPTFLRFSPSDVRFKVMVLFFQYMVDNEILALPERRQSAVTSRKFIKPVTPKRTIAVRENRKAQPSTSTSVDSTAAPSPVEESDTSCLQPLSKPSTSKDVRNEPETTVKIPKSAKQPQLKSKVDSTPVIKKRPKRTSRKK